MHGGDDPSAKDFPVSQWPSSLRSLQVGPVPVMISCFICHGCFDCFFIRSNFIFRLGLPSNVCPKCRSEITGRAHDTEQFLISVPKADLFSPSPQNPTKSKMSNETKDCETLELLPPQGQNDRSGEIQFQPTLAVVAENIQGVQARQQPAKSGTPKALKRVTWSPSVHK